MRFVVEHMRGLPRSYWVRDSVDDVVPESFCYRGPADRYAVLRNRGLGHEAAMAAMGR